MKQDGELLPVARTLRVGFKLYRARAYRTLEDRRLFSSDPMKHLGPPPNAYARAGRMNAEGVSVLYCATDVETCLAELRPAIGSQLAVAAFQTTEDLRILDFTRLAQVAFPDDLDIFHSDYFIQKDRQALLRHLHFLISQPITPEREANYLITQTMAEFLAHVHSQPFDGIAFSSTQRVAGTNIVIFPRRDGFLPNPSKTFRINLVEKSFRNYRTQAVNYQHVPDHSIHNPHAQSMFDDIFDDEIPY